MHLFIIALAALLVAVTATPYPQAVTENISPSAAAPSGCTASFSTTFGIAVVTIGSSTSEATASMASSAQASSEPTVEPSSAAQVSQISDGQAQAATTVSPIVQITDGQIQHRTTSSLQMSFQPVSQIGDGQIQATYSPITSKSTIVSAVPASQISDGQPQAATSESLVTSVIESTSSVLVSSTTEASTASSTAATSGSDLAAVGCKSDSTLELTLNNGVLLDSHDRTGYIASNFQFQFDKPAQAGAIYTAGWSVCSNGSLALGDSSVFWQCLSGDFYNLYDRNFGADQCMPVLLQVIDLEDCAAS